MHFAFTDEQEQLRRGARRFLDAQAGSARVRTVAASDTGWDLDAWRRIASELGWPALVVPEAHGGAGLGAVELVAILEETGRVLLPSPFFATCALATSALLASGDEAAKQTYLPKIAEGQLTATLAWPGTAAVGRDGTLFGRLAQVVDGHAAELLVVAGDDASLYLVPYDAPGLTRRALPTLDRTRRLAELTLANVAATRLGAPGAAPAILAATLDLANVALAAEQLGGAQRCLEMAVDYAKTRVQFGRAIGSFQAIKHKCADLFVAVESARSAVYWAADAAAQRSPDLPLAAATARATASEAFYKCAAENIQIHGGIGFTWEHDAHLFFRRARAGLTFLGDVAAQRERVATAILGAL
jgi:alkylation response protein AidB-like acyl-CoA dehydrogenase